MGAIRGAICAQNTSADISSKSLQLVNEIIAVNSLNVNDIQAIFFSTTRDLNACYPAKRVREELKLDKVAFMCFQEMETKDSLPKCIRVCVLVDRVPQSACVHCYLGEASSLRSDLKK